MTLAADKDGSSSSPRVECVGYERRGRLVGMKILQHDVLIVGGGGAGLRAAIAVAQDHPDSTVGVISKVYPMRSHTVSAEGGAAAVISPTDSLDDHAYDTISGSDWLADQDAVQVLVENAPKDTVTALPGQVTRIRATFDKPGRYVWHCHILSHEDHEMMRVLDVR